MTMLKMMVWIITLAKIVHDQDDDDGLPYDDDDLPYDDNGLPYSTSALLRAAVALEGLFFLSVELVIVR